MNQSANTRGGTSRARHQRITRTAHRIIDQRKRNARYWGSVPSWFWFWCHVRPLGARSMSLWRTLEGRIGEMCELLHTRTLGIASQCFLAALCGGTVAGAAAHRTRYGAALPRVFVRDLGLHARA